MRSPIVPLASSWLLIGAAGGFIFPFATLLLYGRGLDAAAIGVVTAIAAAAGIASAPALGHISDVVLGRRLTALACSLAAGLSLLVFGLPVSVIVIAIAWMSFVTWFGGLNSLATALSVNALRGSRRADFGQLRSLLSLAFAVTSIGAGLAFDATGYEPAPFIAAGALLLLGVVLVRVPDVPRASIGDASARRGGSLRAALIEWDRLPLVALAFGLAGIGTLAIGAFLPLRMEDLGGSPSQVAFAFGLEAISEVPAFVLAGLLARRFGLRSLFVASAVLMAITTALLAVIATPEQIIATRVVAGVAFAGLIVTSAGATSLSLPPFLQTTGIAANSMVAGALAITANAIGGILYQLGGAEPTFGALALLTVLGAALGSFVVPRSPWARVAAVATPGPDEVIDD